MTIELEGKWMNLRRLVNRLVNDGWVQVSIEPNAEFTLTTVVLTKVR